MARAMASVCALMTCHNRRDQTLACLAALFAARPAEVDLSVVLVDAGSGDGTADAVRARHPEVVIVSRGPDVYWNQGMREAWTRALSIGPDFFLWLNDDLIMRPEALASLLETYAAYAPAHDGRLIVTGRIISPSTGATTYGGYLHKGGVSRLSWRLLQGDEVYCDTMHGNLVLIPAIAATEVGIMSEKYSHAFGDIDYGLRARRAGYAIVQCPTPSGEQDLNEAVYSGRLDGLSWRKLGFILQHPKGVPWREWLHFCRSFGGVLWPLNFVWRYVRIFRPARPG